MDGVFVQIGLAANSASFRDVVEMNRSGEIVIDTHGRTNVPGIYAAGDVSTVPYKQIIIAMGEVQKLLYQRLRIGTRSYLTNRFFLGDFFKKDNRYFMKNRQLYSLL